MSSAADQALEMLDAFASVEAQRFDITFCLLAIDWGWGVEETAARLMQESGKAQENGEAYALRTARNAAAAIASGEGRQLRLWPVVIPAPPRRIGIEQIVRQDGPDGNHQQGFQPGGQGAEPGKKLHRAQGYC